MLTYAIYYDLKNYIFYTKKWTPSPKMSYITPTTEIPSKDIVDENSFQTSLHEIFSWWIEW